MSTSVALLITLLLLIGNAYFVACEFAVMGSRRSRIEPLVDQGKRGARQVLYALEHVTLMLATCQLGVTLCSVALGAISEPAIAHLLEKPLEMMHVPHSLTHPIAFIVALILVVFLHVVMGEMVPKNVTITHPETLALVLSPLLVWISKVFYPIVALLNWLSNHLIRIFGVEPKDEVASAFTADEVASIVEVSEKAGVLNADVELLAGALEFSEHTAGELMVPLDDLAVVHAGMSAQQFEELAGKTGFSRFPVASKTGELIGYMHVKDVLDVPESMRSDPISSRKIRSLPEVMSGIEVEAALRTMQKAHSHMAIVMAGDGDVHVGMRDVADDMDTCAVQDVQSVRGVRGVIFLEDIVEELVGEVRDAMQRH